MVGESVAKVVVGSWREVSEAVRRLINARLSAEAPEILASLAEGPSNHQWIACGDAWRIVVQRLPDDEWFRPGVPWLVEDTTIPERRT